MQENSRQRGFTLIELSIVLVIIGLIVGGILVGQNLIAASQVRATITQVEKYNTAANTFREKTGYLPGDINAAAAVQFGLAARGQYAGEGDGNGLIEGVWGNDPSANGFPYQLRGETVLFWADLSQMGLIEGQYTVASCCNLPSVTTAGALYPAAKLGNGNYFLATSGVSSDYGSQTGVNYFSLATLTQVGDEATTTPGLTVAQAFAIDTKVDDGLPQSGNVQANYLTGGQIIYAIGGGGVANGYAEGAAPVQYNTSPVTGTSSTCYDNRGIGTAAKQYSVEISNGSNVNCALAFKMQAGD
jgi:prepilin-type N-terminal cleavage/methylation domain-containing protein